MVSWIDGLGQSDHVNSVHFQQSLNLKLTREKCALYVFTKFDNWDVLILNWENINIAEKRITKYKAKFIFEGSRISNFMEKSYRLWFFTISRNSM